MSANGEAVPMLLLKGEHVLDLVSVPKGEAFEFREKKLAEGIYALQVPQDYLEWTAEGRRRAAARFKIAQPFGKQNFLRWYDTYKGVSPKAVSDMLKALVEGDGNDAEKLQFVRDEIAAGRG